MIPVGLKALGYHDARSFNNENNEKGQSPPAQKTGLLLQDIPLLIYEDMTDCL